jgi:hypothetical protein
VQRVAFVRAAQLLLGLLFVAIVAPAAASAAKAPIKLALSPVGQAGSFFDLTMRPGAVRNLQVDVANDGDATLAVRTYATDAYTIVNGGFGGRLRDTVHTGMTKWLDYGDEVVVLSVGHPIRRGFTVRVPSTAPPGEYIAGLVLENDQPIRGAGAVGLNQIIRQVVAVVVTVPGTRSPALAIGAATHKVVGGTSTVSIAVQNTGNVRLKPAVDFTLYDPSGSAISHSTIEMDTFYAHTDTFVEMPLSSLLAPGTYTVRLILADAASGAGADEAAIPFVVGEPPVSAAGGVTPALIDVFAISGASRSWLGTAAVLVALAALLVAGVAILIALRRRPRHGRAPRSDRPSAKRIS